MHRAWLVSTAAIVFALAPAGASAKDYAATALNVIPSGQAGGLPVPPGADAQAKMYDDLTPLFDQVTQADLLRGFKSERFGVGPDGPARVERVPHAGVKLVRDRFDVPHITARSHDGLTWAAGWVVAEDRALLLQQARYNSRVAAIDAPNMNAIDLVARLRSFEPSRQTEREVSRQTGALRRAGRKGRQLLHDIDVYLRGINAYLRASKSTNKPWMRNDVYALNALKGQFLGQGGGDEARRSAFLSGLQSRLGAARGWSVFDDLRQRNNPEAPVSLSRPAPYAPLPRTRAGNVVVDAGSYQPVDAGGTPAKAAVARRAGAKGATDAAARLGETAAHPGQTAPAQPQPVTAQPTHASNILMVSGKRSVTGHPLFLGGPQIGYFYPGLTLEMDLHAPGIDVRGATSVPFPGYMLIGRGPDFAWTLTSAGGDIVDQFAETLCGGDEHHYRFRGRCRPMSRFDAGVLKGSGGQPDQRVAFWRTVHGPVVAYATVKGRRVAISSKRSSYGRDVLDQLAFQDLTLGRVHDPASFAKAMRQTPQTFNAFYADDRHISQYTTGRLPIRARDVDPGLPTNGDGRHEWRGFLSSRKHPQQVDPPSGTIVNWNNQSARGFSAADDEWGYGSKQRVDLLNLGLAKHATLDLPGLAGVMNAAATQDVRAVDIVPTLAAVLGGAPAPSARDQRMLDLLVAWRAAGGSRLDRDGDGAIDDPGAAIMDAAWPLLADAAMAPVLGPQLDELDGLLTRYDKPPGGQFGGWHGYLDKDLRTLLGQPVKGPFAVRYCGAGDLSACRASLWQAMHAAGDQLEGAQGADPAAWRASATAERMTFRPGLLSTTLRYANRPSGIQQAITFAGHRKRR
jgi:acyl-homoserine lactone acylase PvdQ